MSAGVYRPDRTRRGAAQARARITTGAPLLLDGATGTELERRRVPTPLPAWSAPALTAHAEVVRQIHADYVEAGAEALTANTFRTQARALRATGLSQRAGELTARAVTLAREGGAGCLVFGSAPPLEDCYRPDKVPDDAALAREHAEHAGHLARAGVDAVLVETMNSRREAAIATRAVVDQGLVALASFVCWEGAKLLSGEPLAEAATAARDAGAEALLVNCLPPSNVIPCLEVLARASLPYGAYANLGEPSEDGFTRSEDCTPQRFAAFAATWLAAGAHIIGGCCGTTPSHIAATRRTLDDL